MTEYDYYLTAVKEDGVSLFDVPYVYQTNELIMIALETSEKPIHLMTKLEIEMCIRNRREKLSNIDPIYRQPITDEELKSYLCDLPEIINLKYDNYFSKNVLFAEKKLYTFIDFFSAVCELYSGMDTICYLYLFRGNPIPIKIKCNGIKRNFKLIYNSLNKVLSVTEILAEEYMHLWVNLSQKLEHYYGKSSQLNEYCMKKTTELTEIPILQDGEYYEIFKTIEKNGIIFDYTCTWILKVPNDVEDFTIPENCIIPDGCFMRNKKLKSVKFPSTLHFIPKAAFMDCESLEEIDLSLVKTSKYSKVLVGSAAFCNCKSLKSIDMSKLKIEDGAEITFAYCSCIEDISEIELSDFKNTQMNFFHCDNLRKLVRNPYAYYGDFDLAYCHSIRKINIPRYNIPMGMLCGCDRLESVEITETGHWRKEFGDYCFAGCKSLREINTLEGGVKIGKYAFADCECLCKFVINKQDEWYTVISESAFEGSPQVQIEWADDSILPKQEHITNYWKRKDIETEKNKQNEKENGIEAKRHYIKVLDCGASDNNVIGKFFEERGRYIGKEILAILQNDVCSWEEYLKIGRLFYECIPFSNMNDYGYIRTAIVSWAKSCSVQAYLKAPIHAKFDAIQQIYNILKISHSYFNNHKIVYGEKSRKYAKVNVLNTHFDYQELEIVSSDEQKSFIKSYTSLSDIEMSYLMQYYLLIHLVKYNTIYNKKGWDYNYAKKEINRINRHIKKLGTITQLFLMNFCRATWQQFIKDDIEKNYEEMGEDNVYLERNESDYISFDFSTMEICRKTELIDDSSRRGENLLIPNKYLLNNQL